MTRNARQFYRDAVRRRLITESPFTDVKPGCQTNAARQRFIDRDTIDRVMDAAPSAEWRLIIALARYAGLRVPSELAGLKWSDILWAEKRIVVTSPKTEHHAGRDHRVCPMFPEIETHLLAVFADAEPGAVYLFGESRRRAMNLRTQFQRIMKRAGVAPWPKLFQNLRASRATELANDFPVSRRRCVAWTY